MNNTEEFQSSFLKYLPAVLRGDNEGQSFLGRFLYIFEKLLTGSSRSETSLEQLPVEVIFPDSLKGRISYDASRKLLIWDGGEMPESDCRQLMGFSCNKAYQGAVLDLFEWSRSFSQRLEVIHRYSDPAQTPLAFVDWLASWMGLVLKEDWTPEQKRKVIARIIPIYRMRGTKRGLEEFLKIYVGGAGIMISEFADPFQIGVNSQIGVDTVVGQGRPYYFQVSVELPIPSLVLKESKKRAIIGIIDQEKPVNTYYNLVISVPTMRIGRASRIGADTLLGGVINTEN